MGEIESSVIAGLKKSATEFPLIQGTPFWRQKMRIAFRRMDTNCDGVLTIEDFKAQAQRIIEAKGLKGEEAEGMKKWRENTFHFFSGSKKSKVITETEFVENSLGMYNSEKYRKNAATAIKKWFEAFDLNDDNLISREEHKKFFKFLMATSKESEETFDILDKNHDGWLTVDEFLHGFLIFFLSEDPSFAENNFFGTLVDEK